MIDYSDKEFQKQLVKRIKEVRKSRKLSQKAFGDRLNISQGQIGSYETGHRNIPERTVKEVCDKFGINEDWFITGNGEMNKDLLEDFDLDAELKELAKLYLELPIEKRQKYKDLMLSDLDNE
ncbi:helix-turn-helix domain-containing protein [Romboutsia sp. 1001285H_161024_C4]|uniref:helix-turn-helix domain-containing protein n=1 Tax=Romboutsia sp. 1001285H_161024_C4 TaxID=2787109 RepID=UPI0024341223|nr:helix-turn-helix transcriptional regulator [Romboutsia sp. 1001285H_161024_C4]